MATSNASYHDMIRDALRNLDQSGASLADVKTFVFTYYHVKRGFANWVEHVLRQMVGKGEVSKENNTYTLIEQLPRPRINFIVSLWHALETTELAEEKEEVSLTQEPSSSKTIRRFQARMKKRKKRRPPSAYEMQVKERLEKECFICEKKGCTSCRKTPQEIFQTRQKLWAKAQEEGALYLKQQLL